MTKQMTASHRIDVLEAALEHYSLGIRAKIGEPTRTNYVIVKHFHSVESSIPINGNCVLVNYVIHTGSTLTKKLRVAQDEHREKSQQLDELLHHAESEFKC